MQRSCNATQPPAMPAKPKCARCCHLRARALAYADRAVTVAPQLPACWRNRAAVHQRMGSLKKAEDDYAIAIELEPVDPRLYVQRGGVIAAQWKRMREAMTDYATALHLDDNADLR